MTCGVHALWEEFPLRWPRTGKRPRGGKGEKMNGFWKEVMDNAVFVAEALGSMVVIVFLTYLLEKTAIKRSGSRERVLTTRKIAMIGMFSAIAAILMVLEFPVPFAPPFYKLDFSELPILVGSFAFGPVAGVLMELCKVLLKLLGKGSSTAFVGDFANFLMGCSFILPASLLYYFKKTKKRAFLGCMLGTVIMAAFGTVLNGIYLLPKFSQIYGMPLDAIVGMGTQINPAINSVSALVMICVAPLNLLKGCIASAMTLLIYKKISPILHRPASGSEAVRRNAAAGDGKTI